MNLVEIFSSVQGEGPWVGVSSLFVRLGECDLRCRWCDSPQTWRPAKTARIEEERGSGCFRTLPNPVSVEAVVDACRALEASRHRFVSLTGGEPLLQPDAVAALAPTLRALGTRVYLETHGLATEALERVVADIDVVAMDWKLASDVERAQGPSGPFHAEHEAFLRVARRAPEVLVKLVLTPATEDAELDEAWARIAGVDPRVPVVLQPVTPFGKVREAPAAGRLLGLVERASRVLEDVRLIPQTHPVIGAL